MNANRTPNVHTHRIRHRRRLRAANPLFAKRHRKLANHTELALAEMNAIGGVSGVTSAEVLDSIRANVTINPAGVRDIQSRDQRGLTLVAEVEALGIPIA